MARSTSTYWASPIRHWVLVGAYQGSWRSIYAAVGCINLAEWAMVTVCVRPTHREGWLTSIDSVREELTPEHWTINGKRSLNRVPCVANSDVPGVGGLNLFDGHRDVPWQSKLT